MVLIVHHQVQKTIVRLKLAIPTMTNQKIRKNVVENE